MSYNALDGSKAASYSSCLRSLPDDKIPPVSELKTFEDDSINIDEIGQFCFYRVENNVGHGENAGYQIFFPFSTMLSKGFLTRGFKIRYCT